jgi:hypothetical protein
MSKKILTPAELRHFYSGKGCKCAASSQADCGCANADWSTREEYRLRWQNKILRAKLAALKKASNDSIRDRLVDIVIRLSVTPVEMKRDWYEQLCLDCADDLDNIVKELEPKKASKKGE